MSVVRTADAASQRKIAFAAPETIHGALKQIVGWTEMNGIHVQGKPLTEREFINGIPASAVETLTACMPKTWADRWFPWSVDTHRQAVARACVSAEIPTWHPHQLRHGLATHLERIMGESGREAARLLLSHTNAKTTERYVAPSPESLAVILDMISDQSDF